MYVTLFAIMWCSTSLLSPITLGIESRPVERVCSDVCWKDKCEGTRTNSLPMGDLWDEVVENNGNSCCLFGHGSCSTCCRPIDEPTCKSVCAWDLCQGRPSNPIPSGLVWEMKVAENGKSCCGFGLGPCSTCCEPSSEAKIAQEVEDAATKTAIAKKLHDAHSEVDSLRNASKQREHQKTNPHADASFWVWALLLTSLGIVLVCCLMLCCTQEEKLSTAGEEPLLGDTHSRRILGNKSDREQSLGYIASVPSIRNYRNQQGGFDGERSVAQRDRVAIEVHLATEENSVLAAELQASTLVLQVDAAEADTNLMNTRTVAEDGTNANIGIQHCDSEGERSRAHLDRVPLEGNPTPRENSALTTELQAATPVPLVKIAKEITANLQKCQASTPAHLGDAAVADSNLTKARIGFEDTTVANVRSQHCDFEDERSTAQLDRLSIEDHPASRENSALVQAIEAVEAIDANLAKIQASAPAPLGDNAEAYRNLTNARIRGEDATSANVGRQHCDFDDERSRVQLDRGTHWVNPTTRENSALTAELQVAAAVPLVDASKADILTNALTEDEGENRASTKAWPSRAAVGPSERLRLYSL